MDDLSLDGIPLPELIDLLNNNLASRNLHDAQRFDLERDFADVTGAILGRIAKAGVDLTGSLWRRHSDDFTWCCYDGHEYVFSPKQATVVRVLWEAAERGVPVIHSGRLLGAADSRAKSLHSLFQGHPAWGRLILADRAKGFYRLSHYGAGDENRRLAA